MSTSDSSFSSVSKRNVTTEGSFSGIFQALKFSNAISRSLRLLALVCIFCLLYFSQLLKKKRDDLKFRQICRRFPSNVRRNPRIRGTNRILLQILQNHISTQKFCRNVAYVGRHTLKFCQNIHPKADQNGNQSVMLGWPEVNASVAFGNRW